MFRSRPLWLWLRWIRLILLLQAVFAALPAGWAAEPAPGRLARCRAKLWEAVLALGNQDSASSGVSEKVLSRPSKTAPRRMSAQDARDLGTRTYSDYLAKADQEVRAEREQAGERAPKRLKASDPRMIRHEVSVKKRAQESFEEDFLRLADHRARRGEFRDLRGFKKWLVANLGRNPPAQGETLVNYQGYLWDIYNDEKQRKAGWFLHAVRRVTEHPLPSAVATATAGIFLASYNKAQELFIFTAGNRILSALADPLIAPVANQAGKVGQQYLGGASLVITHWLSDPSAVAKAKHTRDELRKLDRELGEKLNSVDWNKLSPQEKEEFTNRLHASYLRLYLDFNSTMPAQLRDGRSFFADWLMNRPVTYAAALSQFRAEYDRSTEKIEELRKQLGTASGADRKTLEDRVAYYEQSKLMAESQMATTLALWKVFEIAYDEATGAGSGVNTEPRLTYQLINDSLQIPVYLSAFRAATGQILEKIDQNLSAAEKQKKKP